MNQFIKVTKWWNKLKSDWIINQIKSWLNIESIYEVTVCSLNYLKIDWKMNQIKN